jgi:2-polyprenyl-3-methyl-5-hydroxy-6-metoxy-1,4-benzoquinol methylase
VPEHVVCNLCGSDAPRLLYRSRDYRLRIDETDWAVVRCTECGLGYLDPRPTPEESEQYYPAQYFDRNDPATLGRYEREAAYVPAAGGRLLDIGTADGGFLRVMKERGFEVEGIDGYAPVTAPDLKVHRALFPSDTGLAPASYDVITAWAVFEHLRDPAGAFRECARLLRPGGLLVIQVPNLRSVFGRMSLQEDVPRHLYCFSPRTLKRYATRAGLQLERVIHTTDLFGGSGRGVLRLLLTRAAGGTPETFFDFRGLPRRERFRRRPIFAAAWHATAAVEHVVLADRVVRAARISGQIVAQLRRPTAGASQPG